MSGPSEPLNPSPSPPQGGGALGAMRDRVGGLAESVKGDGLRARALRGAGWTTIGFGISQVLRLGSNLVLTRLLFPEAFGLMALAQVFMQGLNMLSDIGVGPSIIQNKRGDDPDFLATAWTMQVIRGFTLFLCMCALAYPASLIYDQPLLFPILLLIGTTSVIQGFQSIGVSTASRKLMLGRLTALDLIAQCVGIAVMVTWASFSRDVWALVGGGVVAALVRLGLGYLLLGSAGNRFRFDRSAAHDIFHFGKWIFLATAMTYFGGQGLRLIQGVLVPIDVLGTIAIAAAVSTPVFRIIDRIVRGVLFPAFSELYRRDPGRFVAHVRESRKRAILFTSPFFVMSMLFGQALISLLYTPAYHDAGLYFVILSAVAGVRMLRVFFRETLLVHADSFSHALVMFGNMAFQVLGVILGYVYGGVVGMLWGGVIAEVLIYPVVVWRVRRHGVWVPSVDILMLFVYVGLCAFCTWRAVGVPA